MIFVKIIKHKKFALISALLFLYVGLNLVDGERGLISYYKKIKTKNDLIEKREVLISKLAFVEKKNRLLSGVVDLDYLETLYRNKFMVGKSEESIFKSVK